MRKTIEPRAQKEEAYTRGTERDMGRARARKEEAYIYTRGVGERYESSPSSERGGYIQGVERRIKLPQSQDWLGKRTRTKSTRTKRTRTKRTRTKQKKRGKSLRSSRVVAGQNGDMRYGKCRLLCNAS